MTLSLRSPTTMTPPERYRYAAFYCEENIWWLCQHPELSHFRRRVLVVSNESRTCALFAQRAQQSPDVPVVWDYHVLLLVGTGTEARVWDLDCSLGLDVLAGVWLEATFPRPLPPTLEARFRIVDATEYVAVFSSDREHMRAKDRSWLAPAPPWPPIMQGPPSLDRLIDMSDPWCGQVMDLRELRGWLPGYH